MLRELKIRRLDKSFPVLRVVFAQIIEICVSVNKKNLIKLFT